MVLEPTLGLSPSRISSYNTLVDYTRRDNNFRQMLKSYNGINKHRGKMSKKAASRIRSKVEWLCFLAKKRRVNPQGGGKSFDFRINFITLTLPSPQVHDDNTIKKQCLNQFLTECRQKFGMRNYVWKAELQGNENIHFHITTDTYIHHETIRNIWNRIISKLSYVSAYQQKMQAMSFQAYHKERNKRVQCSLQRSKKGWEFGNKTNWCSPNTTDVKSVKNVRNLAAYLAKYLTKEIAKDESSGTTSERVAAFSGNLWYCSTSLSRLSTYKTHPSKKALQVVDSVASIKSSLICMYDYCECIYFQFSDLPHVLRKKIRQVLMAHALATGYQIQFV